MHMGYKELELRYLKSIGQTMRLLDVFTHLYMALRFIRISKSKMAAREYAPEVPPLYII